MTNIKSPRSFRLDVPTAEAFSCFAKNKGITQDEAMNELLDFYKLVEAKKMTPSREKEIVNFTDHVRFIISEYVRSLEIESKTEQNVRHEFMNSMESKDEIIRNLQEEVRKLRGELDVANNKIEEADYQNRKMIDDLKHTDGRIASAEKTVKDKESIIEMLQKKLVELESKLNEGYELKQVVLGLRNENDNLKAELNAYKKEAEYDKEKAVNATKMEISEEIVSLKIELSGAIASAAEKDKQLERMDIKYAKLENTVINLKTQIATLTPNKMD